MRQSVVFCSVFAAVALGVKSVDIYEDVYAHPQFSIEWKESQLMPESRVAVELQVPFTIGNRWVYRRYRRTETTESL
jgi:hypothetical protein